MASGLSRSKTSSINSPKENKAIASGETRRKIKNREAVPERDEQRFGNSKKNNLFDGFCGRLIQARLG